MKSPPADSAILESLVPLLVDALRVPLARIQPGAKLFAELGAESIDLLDIRFRMEHVFGIKIEQDDIGRSLGDDLSAAQVREQLTVDSLVRYVRRRLEASGPA